MDMTCPGCADYPCRCEEIVSRLLQRSGTHQRLYTQADLGAAVAAERDEIWREFCAEIDNYDDSGMDDDERYAAEEADILAKNTLSAVLVRRRAQGGETK